MCNYPKLDLVNINAFIKFGENMSNSSQDIEQMNAYIKFGEILPIGSQDIERKGNFGIKLWYNFLKNDV